MDWCWSWSSNTLTTWWEKLTLKKTLMLERIEGRRRRGRQSMRWLDGITDLMDMSLSKLQDDGQGSLACCSPWESQKVRHDWATELNWTDVKDIVKIIKRYSYYFCWVTTQSWYFKILSSVQLLSHVRLCEPVDFSTPGFPVHPTPGACSNSCPSSQWCHPTISSSLIPFSFHLQSFPASGSFQMSQFFTSGGQSIGVSASASVLPMNTQDWSLGWTFWESLKSLL